MNADFERRKGKNEKRLPARKFLSRFALFALRFSLVLSVFICVHPWFLTPANAQEVVVNLSSGRAIVCVARGGIVIATVQKPLEAESRPPVLAELSPKRVAVLLGATEWISPAGEPPVRMERELPRVMGALVGGGPRLSDSHATDLEGLGLGMLEPLREAAQRLVQKVDMRRDEPLLEMVLVGYLEGYGPEIWTLRYRIVQEPLRSEYWQTRVLRPLYTQLYPPEKGQPRTLMEARYPALSAESAEPTLLELLQRNDPRMAALRNADEATAQAVEKILAGESHKAPLEGVVTLLRGALLNTMAEDEVLSFSVIDEQKGFAWIVPQELPDRTEATEKKERPPGAPTLRKPPQ